jgi:hypothetical protein
MVSVFPDLSIVAYCQFNSVQNSAKISAEYDNFFFRIVAGLLLFFRKYTKRHNFDFRFRWPLPNIRFWPNIRPIVSAKTTFGRTLVHMPTHLDYVKNSEWGSKCIWYVSG